MGLFLSLFYSHATLRRFVFGSCVVVFLRHQANGYRYGIPWPAYIQGLARLVANDVADWIYGMLGCDLSFVKNSIVTMLALYGAYKLIEDVL